MEVCIFLGGRREEGEEEEEKKKEKEKANEKDKEINFILELNIKKRKIYIINFNSY